MLHNVLRKSTEKPLAEAVGGRRMQQGTNGGHEDVERVL